MGSFKRTRVFDPLDLEVMDLVYKAAWVQLSARDPFRDLDQDPKRQETLRKKVVAAAIHGNVEFDTLLDRVLEISPAAAVSVAEEGSRQEAGS